MAKISYPKAMREYAKANGKHLITLSAGGMTMQRPSTEAEAKEVAQLIVKFCKASEPRKAKR